MPTPGHGSIPRSSWSWRFPIAARALPLACAAVALASLGLIAPWSGGQPSVVAVALPALAALLFVAPSRRGLAALLTLALATFLVFAALYAARAIGAL